MKSLVCGIFITVLGLYSLFPRVVVASESVGASASSHDGTTVLLFMAILLLAARMGGIIERFGQPAVLGELLAGIVLSGIAYFAVPALTEITHDPIMTFIAEFGAILLLFQIGLESNISKMMKVGITALTVAIIGVVVPFFLGTYVAGPLFFPQASFVSHLFIGASVVATSVGITASVFKSLHFSKNPIAQIVLGAAVFDDVLGLLVLAVVSAIAAGGVVTPSFVGILSLKAFGFLIGSILVGNIFAGRISALFAHIHSGVGMKLAIAVCFALTYSYLATVFGLAPIVGAFAAGLILDATHFSLFEKPSVAIDLIAMSNKKKNMAELHAIAHKLHHAHVEDMISSIGLVFIPFFFVFTGMQIDFASLLELPLYAVAAIIAVLAALGKMVAGIAVKGTYREKLITGISMVPRGEVGLIFAAVGKNSGAISGDIFSVIILVIMITTFIAPPLLKFLISRSDLPSPARALSKAYAFYKAR